MPRSPSLPGSWEARGRGDPEALGRRGATEGAIPGASGRRAPRGAVVRLLVLVWEPGGPQGRVRRARAASRLGVERWGASSQGWARMLEQGYPAGAGLLRESMIVLREKRGFEDSDLPFLVQALGTALSHWDIDSWQTIARRTIQLARDVGALRVLPDALHSWVWGLVATGELSGAATALAEAEAVSEAMGAASPEDKDHSAWLDAWRFDEPEALRRIDTSERQSLQLAPPHIAHARAVVYNAAGRYEAALAAAERSCELHPTGTHPWGLIDLVEAAVRTILMVTDDLSK